jgi:hypothetical protein
MRFVLLGGDGMVAAWFPSNPFGWPADDGFRHLERHAVLKAQEIRLRDAGR